MEDYQTPAAEAFVAPTTFNYQLPKATTDGARRPNMWKASEERGDRAKYIEAMADREFHSDKGACSGSLLDRSTVRALAC
jgi:hypothetical protein